MHVAALGIYDPATAPRGLVRFKDILRFLESRRDRAPVFRRRLATVPFGVDRPCWIDEGDVDVEYHVRPAVASSIQRVPKAARLATRFARIAPSRGGGLVATRRYKARAQQARRGDRQRVFVTPLRPRGDGRLGICIRVPAESPSAYG